MVDNGYDVAADIEIDSLLAYDLIPYLERFDYKWTSVKTIKDLEKATFYGEMMSHIRNQFRQDGKWLDKKVLARKLERSEEARSKEAKVSQESAKEPIPNDKKTLKKPIASKKLKLDDEKVVSDKPIDMEPKLQDQQAPSQFQVIKPDYTFEEAVIINRELEIEQLWHKLKANKRE